MWGKPRDLENALDECLAGLAQGESLEACLARFPRLREELEPLLRTAQAVQWNIPRAAPPADALIRARNRFLAEAARRRQASAQRRMPMPRFAPVFQRGLATAMLVVMLMVALLGTSSIVSANSLPGDPLYGVKRASERVRLFLTLDAETRATLERYYEALRVAEVKQVVEQGRQVQVDLAGTVERVEGDTVVVEGIPVRLPEAALADAPAVGSKVEIVGQTHEDGTVTVKALSVRATPVVTAVSGSAPAPAATATPPVEQRPTATPTAVPTAKPTATPEPTATPTTVPTAQPSATVPASTATASPSATSTATRTATATTTPVPPPREIVVRIEGRIDEIAGQSWVVNGQRVTLRASTQINQAAAQGQVGGWAIVEAVQTADGQLVARQIIVVRGPQQPPEVREFSGAIASFSATRWVVAGQTVEIVPETVIEGTPSVGALAHVRAEHHADGRLVALRIVVERPQEVVVRFEGLITSFGEKLWVVAGQELQLTAETHIEGQPAVGAIAQVEAVLRQDGVLEARRIIVLAGAPSGPVQTPSPVPNQEVPASEVKEVVK